VWGVQLSCIVKVLQQVARFGKKTKKKKKGYGGDGDDVHLIHEEREREKKNGRGSGDIFGRFPITQDIKS
jgi:hypothetical protein